MKRVKKIHWNLGIETLDIIYWNKKHPRILKRWIIFEIENFWTQIHWNIMIFIQTSHKRSNYCKKNKKWEKSYFSCETLKKNMKVYPIQEILISWYFVCLWKVKSTVFFLALVSIIREFWHKIWIVKFHNHKPTYGDMSNGFEFWNFKFISIFVFSSLVDLNNDLTLKKRI